MAKVKLLVWVSGKLKNSLKFMSFLSISSFPKILP